MVVEFVVVLPAEKPRAWHSQMEEVFGLASRVSGICLYPASVALSWLAVSALGVVSSALNC